MARRKSTEKHIRKLTRVGKFSMSVTIPVEYIRDLKWRERQKVVVKKRANKLIIEDWKKKNKR